MMVVLSTLRGVLTIFFGQVQFYFSSTDDVGNKWAAEFGRWAQNMSCRRIKKSVVGMGQVTIFY